MCFQKWASVRFSVSKHVSAIMLNEKAEVACQRAIRYHRDPKD
jgi:hypothetical protein